MRYAEGLVPCTTPGGRTKPRADTSDAAPFKIDGVYCRLISLTQGQFAIVDAEDYAHLSTVRWCAWWNPKTKSFYAVARMRTSENKSVVVHMHRYLEASGARTDHKNLVTLDNRRKNLRDCNHAQNMWNRKAPASNKTGFKGVSWRPSLRKYHAQLRANNKRMLSALFDDPILAAIAYDDAAIAYHGEFARLNFPERKAA